MSLIWSPDYAPVDGDFADVSLLLKGEGTNGSTTILDSSSNNFSVTAVDNAQIINTVATPFSPTLPSDGVLALDGTGDYLTVPNSSAFDFSTGDLTIEAWVYIAGNSAPNVAGNRSASICGTWTSGLPISGWLLAVTGNTTTTGVGLLLSSWDGSSNASQETANVTIAQQTWHHLAASVSNGTRRLFLNGALLPSNSTPIGSGYNPIESFGNDLRVGSSGNFTGGYSGNLNGYISNLRITKGVARYTSNFTPPTAPFPILSPSTRIEVGDGFDVEAANYILAVEAADAAAGQTGGLEPAVRTAINNFVVGCKSDGIWNAIKASCLLSGARTLEGALVPLKGGAPTNFNFTSSDYDRKTGLVGDGSSKYLDSNRNNNADPRNSFHLSVYASSVGTTGYGIGAGATEIGTSMLGLGFDVQRSRTTAFSNVTAAAGFNGHSRSLSNQYTHRTNASNTPLATTSEVPANLTLFVFARGVVGAPAAQSDARISFYSIGEALPDLSPTQTGLELLDTRISDFITAIGAAIP